MKDSEDWGMKTDRKGSNGLWIGLQRLFGREGTRETGARLHDRARLAFLLSRRLVLGGQNNTDGLIEDALEPLLGQG